ncbi:hypothetical protein UPYG_G00081410 [Umbra pygmaea]|uniref:Uncharacterized protein n=1 Tax=Umbra pygmaea TaxID=75934 RepID=A0ABD0XE79_UMBPY
MFPVYMLLWLSEALADNCSKSDDTFYINKTTGTIWLKKASQQNYDIIIEDKVNSLSSKWLSSDSYIECTPMNVTLNLTECNKANVYILNNTTTKIDFLISSSTCHVTNCTETAILALLTSIQENPKGLDDYKRILNMRAMCFNLFSNNPALKLSYIGVEEGVLHNVLNDSFTGHSQSYNLGDLSMTVNNQTNLTDVTGPMVQLMPAKIFLNNTYYIPETWIPANALAGLPDDSKIVGLVTYKPSDQFVFNGEDIISPVMRIEMKSGTLENLITPLTMTFPLLIPVNFSSNYSPSCQYFNEHGILNNRNNVFWKTDGCLTKTNGKMVECSCNHATPFAVLLIPNLPYDDKNWQILSYISYIGCGLSAFFAAMSLLTYIISRNTSVDNSNSIHVSLSGALFLLNSFFMFNEWGAFLGINGVCIFIAAAIHYSLLSCFTWMAIEAVHLYILLVKVFNTYYRHYMLKLSVVGWGVPGVIVGISLAMQNTNALYGSTHITLADTNTTNTICWITNLSFFYGVNLGYFTMIFVLNSGILLTVTTRICQLQRYSSKGKLGNKSLAWKDICTILGLTCLLGITWGLAFFSTGFYNLPIIYLFTIFNSLQGLFIFLWICGTARKDKEHALNTRSTSAAVNNSTAKPNEDFFPGVNPYN